MTMQLPTEESNENLALAESLDAAGWLIGENESAAEFFARVGQAKSAFVELRLSLERGEKISWEQITVDRAGLIAPSALLSLTAAAQKLYAFALDEAAGFILTQRLGALWGGAAFYDPERDVRFFLLRAEFRDAEKFLGLYSREELLSHEICHIARQPLADEIFDEFFAYQTSGRRLRRYLGNCFIYPRDAWLLLLPSFAIFIATLVNFFYELPQAPFFIAFASGAGYLLIRNQRSRAAIFRAQKNLRRLGVEKIWAALFRATATEIFTLACQKSPQKTRACLDRFIAENFRWRVINRRFLHFPELPNINGEPNADGQILAKNSAPSD